MKHSYARWFLSCHSRQNWNTARSGMYEHRIHADDDAETPRHNRHARQARPNGFCRGIHEHRLAAQTTTHVARLAPTYPLGSIRSGSLEVRLAQNIARGIEAAQRLRYKVSMREVARPTEAMEAAKRTLRRLHRHGCDNMLVSTQICRKKKTKTIAWSDTYSRIRREMAALEQFLIPASELDISRLIEDRQNEILELGPRGCVRRPIEGGRSPDDSEASPAMPSDNIEGDVRMRQLPGTTRRMWPADVLSYHYCLGPARSRDRDGGAVI